MTPSLQKWGSAGRRTRAGDDPQALVVMAVVNPYADQLSFRDDQTRSRRDHVKYLTLIRSIALLHQFQREVRTLTHQGKPLRYIEVTPEDIALANGLAQEVLGRTLDELLPQTRKLLTLLHGWVQNECGLSLAKTQNRRHRHGRLSSH